MVDIDKILSSKVVSMDFETTGENKLIPFQAIAECVSIGWWLGGDEVEGECWSFLKDSTYNRVSWQWFQDTILMPIWQKPDIIFAFQNAPFDIQIAMHYMFADLSIDKIHDLMPRCRVVDTLPQAFLIDENTRRDLKTLSRLRLDKPRKTYKQTEKEVSGIKKGAKVVIKELTNEGWVLYKEKRQKSSNLEENLNGYSVFQKKALTMARALSRKQFDSDFSKLIAPTIIEKHKKEADKKFSEYAIEDAVDTIRVYLRQREELAKFKNIEDWYYKHELPYALHMVEVEIGGINVDLDLLYIFQRDIGWLLEHMKAEIQKEIEEKYGIKNFNPRSHPQVKDLLWVRMRLKPPKWAQLTKSGLPKSDAEIQKYLYEQGNDLCKKLSDYSALGTLHSTFLTALYESGKANGGLVRTGFKSVGTITGRVSSSPNLQNIPNTDKSPKLPAATLIELYNKHVDSKITTKEALPGWKRNEDATFVIPGWEYLSEEDAFQMLPIRLAFIPKPGFKLVVADYSQIELRMLAHLTGDRNLLEAYCRWDCECGSKGWLSVVTHNCPKCGAADGERDIENPLQPVIKGFCLGLDLHSLTAFKLGLIQKFGLKRGRKIAKTVNFGLCYGMHHKTLAKRLDIPDKDALEIHTGYFSTYAGVYIFHKRARYDLIERGYFEYILGNRVRRFFAQKEAINKNLMKPWEIGKVVREIANNLPQGSAADFIKLGVLQYAKEKREIDGLRDSHAALQVHDEVVVHHRQEHSEQCKQLVISCLENVAKISVPILVDAKICNNWAEGK